MTTYIHPLFDGAPVTQGFGANPNNGNNGPGGHNGDDYGVPEGTPVVAVADGVVEVEGWASGDYRNDPHWLVPGAGIRIVLDHGDNAPDSVYGHLRETVIDNGQTVKQGQLIGYTGETGNTMGAHLHFSMYPPGYDLNSPTYGAVNPAIYLNQQMAFRVVTEPVAWVRTEPRRGDNLAPGYAEGIAQGATISVVGHVAGEDPYNDGNNAWYKTKSGYYIWANAAGDDISGIPDLN
jgi:Membrane proteins related to metalloendopeptidases